LRKKKYKPKTIHSKWEWLFLKPLFLFVFKSLAISIFFLFIWVFPRFFFFCFENYSFSIKICSLPTKLSKILPSHRCKTQHDLSHAENSHWILTWVNSRWFSFWLSVCKSTQIPIFYTYPSHSTIIEADLFPLLYSSHPYILIHMIYSNFFFIFIHLIPPS